VATEEFCVLRGLGHCLNKWEIEKLILQIFASGAPLALLATFCLELIWRKDNERMTNTFTSIDQLPITLCAEEVALVLGISRAGAYTLMRSKGFPTIRIGKRMVVPKDKLLAWMDDQIVA